jgi:hypothetical protein
MSMFKAHLPFSVSGTTDSEILRLIDTSTPSVPCHLLALRNGLLTAGRHSDEMSAVESGLSASAHQSLLFPINSFVTT